MENGCGKKFAKRGDDASPAYKHSHSTDISLWGRKIHSFHSIGDGRYSVLMERKYVVLMAKQNGRHGRNAEIDYQNLFAISRS